MPIPDEMWKAYIGGALLRLSNESYQRRAWFNNHAEETSPDEQICQLFDDYLLEDFLSQQKLSHAQREATNRLISLLKSYGGGVNCQINSAQAIDDPQWQEIRENAKEVIESLGPLISTDDTAL